MTIGTSIDRPAGDARVTDRDGAQPAGAHRVGGRRPPGRVVRPLAAGRRVEGAGVVARVDVGQRRLGLEPGEARDGRTGQVPQHRGPLQLEPRAVQHEPADRAGMPVRPQGRDQAARRVAHDHEPRVHPELGADDVERRLELLVVGVEVVDVARRLVRAQAAAVLAQVEGVERGAAGVPVLRQARLEEVVRPAVDVEDRARRPQRLGRRRRVPHEGGHHRRPRRRGAARASGPGSPGRGRPAPRSHADLEHDLAGLRPLPQPAQRRAGLGERERRVHQRPDARAREERQQVLQVGRATPSSCPPR